MAITLGGIELPDDLVWIDEFDWDPVAQATVRTLGGINVIEESALIAGRPITLGAPGQWITRATLLLLRALAATPATTHVLDLHGTEHSVAFRRPTPIKAKPVVEFASPQDTDFYEVQINLMTV